MGGWLGWAIAGTEKVFKSLVVHITKFTIEKQERMIEKTSFNGFKKYKIEQLTPGLVFQDLNCFWTWYRGGKIYLKVQERNRRIIIISVASDNNLFFLIITISAILVKPEGIFNDRPPCCYLRMQMGWAEQSHFYSGLCFKLSLKSELVLHFAYKSSSSYGHHMLCVWFASAPVVY